MRITHRIPAVTVAAALALATLVLTLCAHSARSGPLGPPPAPIPAYYDGTGDLLYVIPGNTRNVFGVDHPAIQQNVANTLYLVPGQTVDHILTLVPGQAGYNPWWNVYIVDLSSLHLDLSKDPVKSEQQLLDLIKGTTITPTYYATLLCQVVPG